MGHLRTGPQSSDRGPARKGPIRRVPGTAVPPEYIPKEDGTKRPLAVTALEDKIVQRAVAAVLNEIYEEDFLGFSYGFRPGRGQHDALDALCVGISSRKVNFILDADIRSFFTEVSQEWVVRFLEHRIGPRSGPMQRQAVSALGDQRILRLIQKWLRAGVLEAEVVTIEEKGTGQGSVLRNPLIFRVVNQLVIRRSHRARTGAALPSRFLQR
jgi:retron-type reverse transcriptase